MGKPRDGSALQFFADPYVKTLKSIDEKGCPVFGNSGSKFGLVLVIGWQQFPSIVGEAYVAFKHKVAQCFDPIDIVGDNSEANQPPAVFLYPVEDLHITIAAFHYFHPVVDSTHEEILISQWRSIVDSASKRPTWPSLEALRFQIAGTQIGAKNGILLWEETSGGIDAMRQCILSEVIESKNILTATLGDEFQETISIPDIIHSTFLRFHRVPTTPAVEVQQRFECLTNQEELLFPIKFSLTTVMLVCERTPCIHITFDDNHVIWKYGNQCRWKENCNEGSK